MQENYNPSSEVIENDNKEIIKESKGGIIYDTGPEDILKIDKKKFVDNNRVEVLNYEEQTPVFRFSKEMDEEIKELKAAKSFSVELAKTARGISEYQLPRIDSFLINLEKESPKDFLILEEKRKEIGKLMKKIFKWEQISRRRDFLKEAKEKEKNRYKISEEKTESQKGQDQVEKTGIVEKRIERPDGHHIAA